MDGADPWKIWDEIPESQNVGDSEPLIFVGQKKIPKTS